MSVDYLRDPSRRYFPINPKPLSLRALLSVCELIEFPLRDPARPGEFGVSRRYVHRIANEWRNRYRRAFGRKGYVLTIERRGKRRVRLVVRAPGVAL